jgi:hypothetical protein
MKEYIIIYCDEETGERIGCIKYFTKDELIEWMNKHLIDDNIVFGNLGLNNTDYIIPINDEVQSYLLIKGEIINPKREIKYKL